VTQYPLHAGVQNWVRDLNRFYRTHPALFQRDFNNDGFQWVDCCDSDKSVLSFLRRSADGQWLLVVINATPVLRESYRLGVPVGGFWEESLNSDAPCYGGSGQGNLGGVEATPLPSHGHPNALTLRLPPLGALYLKPRR
jgi:1,4-alpha-glucan branching enzyme